MLEDKKKLADSNAFITQRKNRRMMDSFEKSKNRLFFLALITGIIIVTAIYFSLDISRIYSVSVINNHYLDKSEILSLSGIGKDDRYLLTLSSTVENRIKGNPFIKDCKVRHLDGNVIQIAVEEKKVIGYYNTTDGGYYILDDDSRVLMDSDNIHIISSVPCITGFTEEDITLMIKNLVNCDYSIINEISEIHNYPDLKYQNVELIMRDGNYIFTSMYGLDILNHYFDIESSYLSSEESCYYFEDISGNAYTSACPWNVPPEEETPADETATDTAADTTA
ncbi:MAG: FtsQ-type POTRA domain-containing protein [Erysipelotrichaceae bacterium]|nr:FtsQ-type POTRA domain-containing protein [Erysipelotrichaceae bacterium]